MTSKPAQHQNFAVSVKGVGLNERWSLGLQCHDGQREVGAHF